MRILGQVFELDERRTPKFFEFGVRIPFGLVGNTLCRRKLAGLVALLSPKGRTSNGCWCHWQAWSFYGRWEVGENKALTPKLPFELWRSDFICPRSLLECECLRLASPTLSVHYRTDIVVDTWHAIPCVSAILLER